MDMPLPLTWNSLAAKGLWRNGSASDSRSEGWEFESLWPHFSFRDAAVIQGFLLFNALLPLPWQCHVTMACQRSQAPSLFPEGSVPFWEEMARGISEKSQPCGHGTQH